MRLLLKIRVDVNETPMDQTALHAAAAGWHYEGIEILLDRGADMTGYATSKTAQITLHRVVRAGHCEAIKPPLDRGTYVERYATTETGQTALHAAAAGGHC